MGHKAAETTHIKGAFSPGTANKCIVPWWFERFCKGDKSLEDEEHTPGHHKLTMTIESIIKADPLTTIQRAAEALNVNHSTVIGHLKQIGNTENSISGCLTSWPKNFNKSSLWSVFSFYETANHFSIRLWHAWKSGFYTTTYNDQLSGWTKKKLHRTFQNQTCTKEMVTVTVWGSAALLIHYSFLNPGETGTSEKCAQQVKMQCKPQHLSKHWPTERAQLLSTTTPTACHTANVSKVERIGLQGFASFAIFTCSLANWLPLLQASQQLFAGKTLPQPARGRKCFPRVRQILKDGFSCCRNKQTYFLLAKCVNCNGSYFD